MKQITSTRSRRGQLVLPCFSSYEQMGYAVLLPCRACIPGIEGYFSVLQGSCWPRVTIEVESRMWRNLLRTENKHYTSIGQNTFCEKIFRLHFSAIRMGSRGTFALLHCKFQMYEDCRSRGRHVLLSCSNFGHERNTYVHGYTRLQSRSQAVQF